ncbi:MAG: hypothetical protein Q4G35_06390 [Propionibacteriaceae bacterium]|nr:hypothetical protein [Propionibacteriaceae bacterium]
MTAQFGRRGLPADEESGSVEQELKVARRAVPDVDVPAVDRPRRSAEPEPDVPRRGFVEEPAAEIPEEESETRRGWLGVIALGIAVAIAVGALWLVFGSRNNPVTATPPAPPVSPTQGPGDTTTPSTTATTATHPAPGEGSPTIVPGSPTGPDDPELGPSPSGTITESTEPTPPGPVPVELNDGATLMMPPGWELYADELVQDSRRLVRMSEHATDVRIQAVTLTSVTSPLHDACLELVADHRQSYNNVAEGLPVAVAISGEGSGVSCNFTGTRTSDNVPTSVEFTLLQRGDITLVFRDTIPSAVPDDSPALAQLVEMECRAAEGFGVTVDQCALTPGQAGG